MADQMTRDETAWRCSQRGGGRREYQNLESWFSKQSIARNRSQTLSCRSHNQSTPRHASASLLSEIFYLFSTSRRMTIRGSEDRGITPLPIQGATAITEAHVRPLARNCLHV